MLIGYEFTRGLRDYLFENKNIDADDFASKADKWFELEVNKHISDRAQIEGRKILIPKIFEQAINGKNLYEYNNSHYSLIAKELGESPFFDLFKELNDAEIKKGFPQLTRIKERMPISAFRADEIGENDVRDLLIEIEGATKVNSSSLLYEIIRDNFKYAQLDKEEVTDAFNGILAKIRVTPKSENEVVAGVQEIANRVYGRRAEFIDAFITLSKSDYASLRAIYKKRMGADYTGEDFEIFKNIHGLLDEENKKTNEILEKIEKLPEFRNNPNKAWGSFVPKVRLMLNDIKEYLNDTYPQANKTFISEGVLRDFNEYLATANIEPVKSLAEVYERCSDEFCDFCVSENNLDHNYAFRIDRSDFDLFMADPSKGFKIDSSINKQSIDEKVKKFVLELDEEAPNEITTVKNISQGNLNVSLFKKQVEINLFDIVKEYSNLELFSDSYSIDKIIDFSEKLGINLDEDWIKNNSEYPLSSIEGMYLISKEIANFKDAKSDAAKAARSDLARRFINTANLVAHESKRLNEAIREDLIDYANTPGGKTLEKVKDILVSFKVNQDDINRYMKEAQAMGINTNPESALKKVIRKNRAKGNFDIVDYSSLKEVNTQRYNLSERNISFAKEYMNYDLEEIQKKNFQGIDTIDADIKGVKALNEAINKYNDLTEQRHNLVEQGNKKGKRLTDREADKKIEKDRRIIEMELRNLYERHIDRLTKEWEGKIKFPPLSKGKWLEDDDIKKIEKVYVNMLTSLKGTDLLMKDINHHIDEIDKTLVDVSEFGLNIKDLVDSTDNYMIQQQFQKNPNMKIDVFSLFSYQKRNLDALKSTKVVEAREDLKTIEGNKKILMFESNYDFIRDNNISKISSFLQEHKDEIMANAKSGKTLLDGLDTSDFILTPKEIERALFNSADIPDKDALMQKINRLRDTHKKESTTISLSDDGTILPYNEIRGDLRSENHAKKISIPLMEVDDDFIEMEREFRNKTPRDGESDDARAKRIEQELKHINKDYIKSRKELVENIDNLENPKVKELLAELREESIYFANEMFNENREAFATNMAMSNAQMESNEYKSLNDEDLVKARFMAKKLGIYSSEENGVIKLSPEKLIQSDYEDRVLVTISEGHDNAEIINSLYPNRDEAKLNFDRIEAALSNELKSSFAEEMKNGGSRFDALCQRADGTSVKASLIDQFGKEKELTEVLERSENTKALEESIAKLEQYIKDNNLDEAKIRIKLAEYDKEYKDTPLFQIKDELDFFQKQKVPEKVAGVRGFFTSENMKRTARSFDPNICEDIKSLADLKNKKKDWLSPKQRSYGRWSAYKDFAYDYEFKNIFLTEQDMLKLREKAEFKTMVDFLNPAKHMLNFFRAVAALTEVGAIITTVAAKASKDRLDYYVGNTVGELLRLSVPAQQGIESVGEGISKEAKKVGKIVSDSFKKALSGSDKIIEYDTYKELLRDSFSHLMKREGLFGDNNIKEGPLDLNLFSNKCEVNLRKVEKLMKINEAKIALGGVSAVDAKRENENLDRLSMALKIILNNIKSNVSMNSNELASIEKEAFTLLNARDTELLKANLRSSEGIKDINEVRAAQEKNLYFDTHVGIISGVVDAFDRTNPELNMNSDFNTTTFIKDMKLDNVSKNILLNKGVLKNEGRDFNIDRAINEISKLYDKTGEINENVSSTLSGKINQVDEILKGDLTPAERREKEIYKNRLMEIFAKDQELIRKRDQKIENAISGFLLMALKQGTAVDGSVIEALYSKGIVSERTRNLIEKVYKDKFTKEGLEKKQREMDARTGKFAKNQLSFN
jgi:hypothetical protein